MTLILDIFELEKQRFRSPRMRNLVTLKSLVDLNSNQDGSLLQQFESKDGLFANVTPLLKEFHESIQWVKLDGGKKCPQPAFGVDEEFDDINKKIVLQKTKLKEYLEGVKKQFGIKKLSYSFNKKYVRGRPSFWYRGMKSKCSSSS